MPLTRPPLSAFLFICTRLLRCTHLLLCTCLLLCFTTSCLVGPNYKKPTTKLPSSYCQTPKSTCSDDRLLRRWWHTFHDPCLDSLIAQTIHRNFDLKIACERIIQARMQICVQTATLWPQFDLDATATRTRNSSNYLSSKSGGSSLPTYQNFFQIGFDAIWEFDIFGRIRRQIEAATDTWQARRADAQGVLISIISEVARTYVNIRALEVQIALTLAQIQAFEAELRLTRDLFHSGLDSQINFDTIMASLANAQSTLPPLQASLKQNTYALAILLGRAPECFSLQETQKIPCGTNRVPVGLPSELIRRRPDIRSAEREVAAATASIGIQVANLFPRFALTGNTFSGGQYGGAAVGYTSGQLNNLFEGPSVNWSIGPTMVWDIFDFNQTCCNIANATSLQRQSVFTYQQTVLTALSDVEGALVAYFNEQRRNHALRIEVDANEKALALTEDLFRSGLASELQVLSAKITLLQSKSQLTASSQSGTTDLIALYKALGGDWECSYTP